MIKDVVNLSTIGTENLSQCELEAVDTPSTIGVNSSENVNSSPEESIAPPEPETASTAPTVPPIAPPEPEPDAELVKQIAATLRKAISVNDEVAVKEIVKNIIKRDSTRRLQTAVKDSLTPEENEACRTLLLNRKQSQPQPVEPPAQTTDSITSSEPEAETEPTDPEVVEDVE
jgi:hypothetical protein